jgi:hypothetical protein
MNVSKPKLSLNRETLKQLSNGDTAEQNGVINTYDCSASCTAETRENFQEIQAS